MAEAASVGDGDAEEINRDGDGVGGIGGRGDWAKSAVGRNNPIQQARPPESRDLFSLAAGDFSVPIWPIGLCSRKCLDAYAMIKQAM